MTYKYNKIFFSFALVAAILIPTQASSYTCSQAGYSIIFVNGILTSLPEAQNSQLLLKQALPLKYDSQNLNILLGYNPSHLGGAADLLQSVGQAFSNPVSEHDLKTILMQLHSEVSTQKILLVGHSQGAFYVNEMYKYLVENGVPKQSIGVYHIGTPASFVAAGGQYVTSKNDKLINWVRDSEVNGNVRTYANSHYTVEGVIASALRANIEIPPEAGHAESDYGGHKFGVYMDGAGDRIVSDIRSALSRLKSSDTLVESGCYNPPIKDAGYKLQAAVFSIADPLAETIGEVFSAMKKDVSKLASMFGKGGTIAQGSSNGQLASPLVALNPESSVAPATSQQTQATGNVAPASSQPDSQEPSPAVIIPEPQNTVPVFEIIPVAPTPQIVPGPSSAEYSPGFGGGGFALNSAPTTSGSSSGAPPASDPAPSTPDPTPADTTPPATTTLAIAECSLSLFGGDCVIPVTTVSLSWASAAEADYYGIMLDGTLQSTTTATAATLTIPASATSTIAITSYDAAGNSATSDNVIVSTISKPLIINEIGWAGALTAALDPSPIPDQWIEIKNISSYDIVLDNFDLYANGSQLVDLSGSLPAGAYLVVQQTGTPFSGAHKITSPFTSLSTSAADRLSLVWSTAEIDSTPLADACPSWCAGSTLKKLGSTAGTASDQYSPLSMERISDTSDGSLAASWQTTDSYGAYLGGGSLWGTPGSANSFNLPEAGVYCPGPNNLAVANQNFNPSGGCTYLSKFISGGFFGSNRYGGLYRGIVSSSTEVMVHSLGKSLATVTTDEVPADAVAGEDYFFAIWENRNFGNDVANFSAYLTAGTGSPPHGNYITIPWIYSP